MCESSSYVGNYIEFLLSFWLACSLEGVGLHFLISSGINSISHYYVNKLISEGSFSLFFLMFTYMGSFPPVGQNLIGK